MTIPRIPMILIAAITVALIGEYLLITSQFNETIVRAITNSSQAANATTTKLFINEVYPRLESQFGLKHDKPDAPEDLNGEVLQRVDETIRTFMLGTDIMKVKIFNTDGLTVYSSDPAQIGENYGDHPPFIAATQGKPGSQISHRGTFSALDGQVYDRDLVSSYIPIDDPNGVIVGVVEIYTDRTGTLERSMQDLRSINFLVMTALIVTFVLMIVLSWSFWWFISNAAPIEALDPTARDDRT
ncbi:MAG: hypothetical protein JJ959_01615 [Nisaea sp.]|uniref:hypothetical protein n=1 Tax=Nisaea sp. TaxID=2024842 RepID=UPI001B147D08|nr:hypothetical protein [Nisaea sp.]MBO6559198.1 hypothetical protein [Nisaea sp.]